MAGGFAGSRVSVKQQITVINNTSGRDLLSRAATRASCFFRDTELAPVSFNFERGSMY